MKNKFTSIDNKSLLIIMIGGNDSMLFGQKGSIMWTELEKTIKQYRV